MSGHSKWSTIKHKKELTDKKRGQIFSKLTKLITVAAKDGVDPETNSKLKGAIEKAKEFNLPNENIKRAIKRVGEKGKAQLETLLIEAIGPSNVIIIAEAITDNKNRTLFEIKSIFSEGGFKMVGQGNLIWQFEKRGRDFIPKMPVKIEDEATKNKLNALFEKLDEHEDIEEIYSNTVQSLTDVNQ